MMKVLYDQVCMVIFQLEYICNHSVHIYVKCHWLLMSQFYEVYQFQQYDRLHGRCLQFFSERVFLIKSQTKAHVLLCQFSTFRGSVDNEQCYIFLLSKNYLVLLIQGYSPNKTLKKSWRLFGITSETWSILIPRQLVSWPGESFRSARIWRAVWNILCRGVASGVNLGRSSSDESEESSEWSIAIVFFKVFDTAIFVISCG